MKRILVILLSPLFLVGYVASMAYILLWVGWQEADAFATKEGKRYKSEGGKS